MKLSPLVKGLIPAGIMCALVLYVFRTLQYYGPESAVWRFHQAIQAGDSQMFNQSIVPPTSVNEDNEIQLMDQWVANRLPDGARLRLQDLERSQDKVIVSVQYVAPNQAVYSNAPFVTSLKATGWKVNVHETIKLWNKLVRPGPSDQG